jgi:hypothetical protein
MTLPKSIDDREYKKFKWTSQQEAVKVAIVENYFSLDLAYKMLSKNTSINLSNVNTVNFSNINGTVEVYFLDSSDNLIATLFYNGASASWLTTDNTLLLQDGSSLLYQDGSKIKL